MVSALVERCCNVMRPSVPSNWAGKFIGSVAVRGAFTRVAVVVAPAAVVALVSVIFEVTDAISLRS